MSHPVLRPPLRRIAATLAILVSTIAVACGDPPPHVSGETPITRSDTIDTSDSIDTSDTIAADGGIVAARVAIFLLADSARIEEMRARHGEDMPTVFDDMMWYRAEAWDWLEARRVPVRSVSGRPPLLFLVGDSAREFEFADVTTADVVVLYEPGREPVAVAPIDVAERAAAYFAQLPEPAVP